MKFSNFVAWRYLISKSSNNAVNIITMVAILGVTVGSFALTIVLSAFSGLEEYSLSMLSTFDPELKISPKEGKHFEFTSSIQNILEDDNIFSYSKTIEEKVFLRYRGMEYICKIKGVDKNYLDVNAIDSNLYAGRWINPLSPVNETVIGGGISHYLNLGLRDDLKSLEVYVLKPGKGIISDPLKSFKRLNTRPVGIFSLEKEIDEKYMFVYNKYVQNLLDLDSNKFSYIEVRLNDLSKLSSTQEMLQKKLGDTFSIKNREQQQELIYRMMNTEKLVTYLVFTLILIIAVFNVIGSTSMLIVDKNKNIKTLWSLGANEKILKDVFMKIGLLISFIGGGSGIIMGVLLVLAQKSFGIIRFGGNIAMPYPVDLKILNIAIVGLTISVIGYLASKISVMQLNRKLYSNN